MRARKASSCAASASRPAGTCGSIAIGFSPLSMKAFSSRDRKRSRVWRRQLQRRFSASSRSGERASGRREDTVIVEIGFMAPRYRRTGRIPCTTCESAVCTATGGTKHSRHLRQWAPAVGDGEEDHARTQGVTHVCQGRIAGWQAAEVGPSLSPTAAEDTLDLGERLDPVRTLLRRSASGDRAAAAALVDVLGPRVHGLALHLLGSARRAESLTVSVLRSCLRDAGQLAARGLPGDVAVLDRARRTATATRPTGDVPSLAEMVEAADRTTGRRKLAVRRVLLALAPAERALVEGAAQGRFAAADRPRAALVLARALDELVPFGPVANAELRGLASLDALGLALPGEQERLRTVTGSAEAAAVHRHAIEAAARLTVLTAVAPSRDLRGPVLDGFAAPAPLAPS